MENKAIEKVSYGLFVVTVNSNDKDNGCILNTVTQVAINPNRISIAINKVNYTHDLLMSSDDFTVSIISIRAEFELFKQFGFQSGRDVDKFKGFKDVKRVSNGTLAITKGTNAYISGKIFERIDLESHTLFIADVTDMDILSNDKSATYDYYHSNIKPQKTSKIDTEKTIWRCRICGYEYEGEEINEDFICPICKHPASDFEKL